jgi:hypothetical protein
VVVVAGWLLPRWCHFVSNVPTRESRAARTHAGKNRRPPNDCLTSFDPHLLVRFSLRIQTKQSDKETEQDLNAEARKKKTSQTTRAAPLILLATFISFSAYPSSSSSSSSSLNCARHRRLHTTASSPLPFLVLVHWWPALQLLHRFACSVCRSTQASILSAQVILALSFSVQFLQLRFTCCRVFLLVLGLVLFRRTGLAGSSFVGLILSEIFWGEKKGKSSTRRPLRRFITCFSSFYLFM